MNYKGKLYGKVGKKYFDTGRTSDDWDEMIDALVEFKRRYSNEVYNQDFHKQVEQALKKAGCVE